MSSGIWQERDSRRVALTVGVLHLGAVVVGLVFGLFSAGPLDVLDIVIFSAVAAAAALLSWFLWTKIVIWIGARLRRT